MKPDDFPAFPSSGTVCDDGILYEGMTLRDYFAAKAMQGMIANGSDVYPRIAEEAYQMADAMMEERDK